MTISQDLHAYGITDATEVLHNPSYEVLFNETTLNSLTGFEKGVVTVIMQGACSGCPSSTVTLKSGIEGMLKRMIPEVTEVVSEMG